MSEIINFIVGVVMAGLGGAVGGAIVYYCFQAFN